jgi:hypothetical protein
MPLLALFSVAIVPPILPNSKCDHPRIAFMSQTHALCSAPKKGGCKIRLPKGWDKIACMSERTLEILQELGGLYDQQRRFVTPKPSDDPWCFLPASWRNTGKRVIASVG